MNNTRCAACRHLRQRCASDCIFAPYFPASNRKRFEFAHKIYGASNIGKMLKDLPVQLRAEAAESLSYEAWCRNKDPVYGVVGAISRLQQQIYDLQSQLDHIQAAISVAKANSQTSHQNQIQQTDGSTASYNHSTWFC